MCHQWQRAAYLEGGAEGCVDWRPAGGVPTLDLAAGRDVALPARAARSPVQHANNMHASVGGVPLFDLTTVEMPATTAAAALTSDKSMLTHCT
jgi:hypothetical protein